MISCLPLSLNFMDNSDNNSKRENTSNDNNTGDSPHVSHRKRHKRSDKRIDEIVEGEKYCKVYISILKVTIFHI